MTREEAKIAAVKLIEDALRPEGIDDEGWFLFTQYVFAYDEEKLADDLLTGLANGHSVEYQTEIAKKALAPYKEQYKKLFDEAD